MKKVIVMSSRMPDKHVSFYVIGGQVVETEFETMIPFPRGSTSMITCLANDTANRDRLRAYHAARLPQVDTVIPEIVAPAPVSKPVTQISAANPSLSKFRRPMIPMPKRPS